jgi:hypothetical protein
MSSQTHRKKRSYSSFYKIYRRIRFVRHKKKTLKRKLAELIKQEAEEQAEIQERLKEFRLLEEKKNRLKLKADREASRKYKKELQEEFRQKKILAQNEWMEPTRKEKVRLKKAERVERIERRRLFMRNTWLQFENFFTSFRSINLLTIKQKIREFKGNAALRKRFAIISFNSTVLYLLAYLGFFLLQQATTVIAAGFFNYPTIVHYYEIYFNISPEAWYHDSVKTIFSSGPLVNFIVGITFLVIYNNIKENTGPFKLFFLWGFLHSVNMLFGALLVGTLFETGVGHVISWMYIMDTGRVLYSIISIFLLVIAGLLATRQFLISANSYYNEINKTNRTSFIIAQVFMPYIIGNILLIILRQPHFIFYDTFISFTLIICILPILVTYRSFNELYFEEDEKKLRITWLTIVILLAVILFFRGVLAIGLRFGG